MKKHYNTTVARLWHACLCPFCLYPFRYFLSIIWIIGFPAVHVQAQQYVTGTGGTNSQFPLAHATHNQQENLYLTSDFTPALKAGFITRVYLMASSDVLTVELTDLTIKIGHTSSTTMASGTTDTFATYLTTVYQKTTTLTGLRRNGWFAIELDTPFPYDGTSNLRVLVSQSGYTATGVGTRLETVSVGKRRIYGSVAATSGVTSADYAHIALDIDTVSSVTVTTQNSVPASITTNGGTLQLEAAVLPASVSQNVTWSIVPGTGAATISASGLVTAQANGTVWGKAVSALDTTKMDSLQITVSNQVVPVTSVTVTTQNSVPASITTNGGTLQLEAAVLPASASQGVTWSIVPGTGAATISASGLVTAQANGMVWGKAVSVWDATKMDSLQITISNQVVPVTSVTVTTQNSVPASITTNGGTLQLEATVLPASASQGVTWSIVPGTGAATISASGLVMAQANGTVWAKAVSVTDPTKKDSLEIIISNQTRIGDIGTALGIRIHPNPVQERFTIYIHSDIGAQDNVQTELYNQLGQLLTGFPVKTGNNGVDMSGLAEGVYFLKIRNNAGNVSYKIIRQ